MDRAGQAGSGHSPAAGYLLSEASLQSQAGKLLQISLQFLCGSLGKPEFLSLSEVGMCVYVVSGVGILTC